LFDGDKALLAPHPAVKDLSTAGDTLAIDSEGVLFAKIGGDAVSPAGGTIIIRAKALYVPTLQSENLLPMGKPSNTNVTLENTDAGTVATINLVDVTGFEASFTTTVMNDVLPLQLTPLSRAEADRYRSLFPEDLGEDAQYAVPRLAGPDVCATALLAALGASATTAGDPANDARGDNTLAELERQAFELADRNAAATANAALLEASTTPEHARFRGDIPYAGTTAKERFFAIKYAESDRKHGVLADRGKRGSPAKATIGDAEYTPGPGQCQCPSCGLDMTEWSVIDRETHGDDCAMQLDRDVWLRLRANERPERARRRDELRKRHGVHARTHRRRVQVHHPPRALGQRHRVPVRHPPPRRARRLRLRRT